MSDGKGARLLSLNRVARITDSFIGPKKRIRDKNKFLEESIDGDICLLLLRPLAGTPGFSDGRWHCD